MVISIIGFLATASMVVFNSVRQKARDVRRKSDLKQIQLALEMYYDANNQYPSSVSGWTHSCNSTWDTLQTALSPYISKLPKDPINTSCNGPWITGFYTYAYGYPQDGFPQKYDLTAALENTSDPDRCGVKKYLYHTGGEGIWCSGGSGYWDQLYADH